MIHVTRQLLRCGLAFAWSSVVGSAIAMDCLYGLPKRRRIETNLGAITEGTANIAVHGHSPVLVAAIVKAARRAGLGWAAPGAPNPRPWSALSIAPQGHPHSPDSAQEHLGPPNAYPSALPESAQSDSDR